MRLLTLTGSIAAFCFSVPSTFAFPIQANNTVTTVSGKITGFVDPAYPDVLQYLGIPYAAPPTGNRRFMPPVPYSSNTSFDATATPKACPQVNSTLKDIWSYSTPQFLNQAPWSEDCLSLSVWTPAKPLNGTEKLPVLIFMHGGGLVSGSASVPYQVPQLWVQRSQKHIVVSLQYRLTIFGFPNAAGSTDNNNVGLLDQRMAIEWVRDNVESFGGDPDRMVLWGQSAGAASSDAQNFAFPDDPIVQGFIQDSGTPLAPIGGGFGLMTIDPDHSNFTFVANGLGCPSTSAQQQLTCMQSRSAQDIISFIANYSNTNTQPPLYFIGTPDEKVVFSNYTARYAAGHLSTKPAIYGSNMDDGNLFAPFPADPLHMGINTTVAESFTLSEFQCPAARSAGYRAATGRKTYRYIYAGNFSDVSPIFWEGSYHATELPQIFGTSGQFRGSATAYEVQVSEAMQDLWLGFAADSGNPEAAGWKEASGGSMLMLGSAEGPAVKVVNETVVDDPCKQAGLA